jgi:hypothetical protein
MFSFVGDDRLLVGRQTIMVASFAKYVTKAITALPGWFASASTQTMLFSGVGEVPEDRR